MPPSRDCASRVLIRSPPDSIHEHIYFCRVVAKFVELIEEAGKAQMLVQMRNCRNRLVMICRNTNHMIHCQYPFCTQTSHSVFFFREVLPLSYWLRKSSEISGVYWVVFLRLSTLIG